MKRGLLVFCDDCKGQTTQQRHKDMNGLCERCYYKAKRESILEKGLTGPAWDSEIKKLKKFMWKHYRYNPDEKTGGKKDDM